jgi:methionyl-tRNA formyltransferase
MFSEYLSWIIDQEKLGKVKLSFIHTNGDLPLVEKDKIGSYNDVIESSDVVFSLGYWRIIGESDIEKVPIGIINFHHSYKLKYKGRHSATWAIRNDEKFHGSTIHFIDKKLDEGKIIDSRRFRIEKTDTAEDVFIKSNKLGFVMLKRNFGNIINQTVKKDIEISKTQHTFRKRDLNHQITFSGDIHQLLKDVRSLTFTGKPSPFIEVEGQKIYLKLEGYDNGMLDKQQ